jgi:hypothetical protein
MIVSAKAAAWLRVGMITFAAFTAAVTAAAASHGSIAPLEWLGIVATTVTTLVNGILGAPSDAREPYSQTRATDGPPAGGSNA